MRSRILWGVREGWPIPARGESLHRDQPPLPSPNLPNLPQPPSGSRLDVRERRHVEKPQPREPRVLVDLDEQQVGDAHDGGGALASYADVRSEERRVGKECRSRWSPYH